MKSLTIVVLLFVVIAAPLGATIFNVDSTIDEIDASPGDGNCVSSPGGLCTLRAAIMEANSGAGQDTINLPAGVYTLSLTGTGEDNAASGDLDVRASLWISGAGTDATIIDAAGLDRAFEVMLADAAVEDLTIRNGAAITADGYIGGGVLHHGTNLWLTRVRVTGNQANAGGGLMVTVGSAAVVQECTFDANSLTEPLFTNSLGAAVYCEGKLSLSSSTITDNTNASGATEVVYLMNCSSIAAIHNTTIAKNNAGGVHSYNCDLTLRNTTIAENAGNGITFNVYTGLSYTLDAANSVFTHNSYSDCSAGSGTLLFLSCLDSDDSCGLLVTNGDLPATDPALLPLRDWGGRTNTMYPKPDESPVIDAGAAPPLCLTHDQRQYPRNNDGDGDGQVGCDMGAVEAGDLIL